MPAGMINMSVAEMSIRRGRPAGLMMAFGAAFVEFFQIFIAIKFASIINGSPTFDLVLNILATIIFLTLMVFYLFFAKPVKPGQGKNVPRYRTFFRGMAVSSINVLIFPYWIFISTYLNTNDLLNLSYTNIAIFALGGMAGGFALFSLYAFLADFIIKRSMHFAGYVNKVIGGLFLVLSVYQIYRMVTIVFSR